MAENTETTVLVDPDFVVAGNLTADPELRYTQNGLAVANFTVARTERYFDRETNEWKDGETLFIRASVWREYAEHAASSLSKGQRVIATGKLKQRFYEHEGVKRQSLELEINEIGPALRYGTAVFQKSASPQQNAEAAAHAPAQAAPVAPVTQQQAPVQQPQAPVQQAPVQAAPAAQPVQQAVPAGVPQDVQF